MGRRAELIVIGNEILSGKVADTNGPWLVRELRELGVELTRITVIQDTIDIIAAVVAEAAGRAEFVFTSGGVGPTLDDLTFEGVGRAFGQRLTRHPELVAIIEGHFGGLATAAHLVMADVPERSRCVWSPGLRFPVIAVENVFVLPGSPEIFRKKFTAIRESFRETPFHLRQVFLRGDEALIAPALDIVAERVPEASLGSYPVEDGGDHDVFVTIESKDRGTVDRAVRVFLEQIDPTKVVRVT